MEEEKLFELLTSVKNMVKTDPAQARTALSSHPNLAYALMKEMVTLDVVDPEVLTRTLQAATGVQPPQPPQQPQQTYAPPQQPAQTYPPPTQNYPPPSQGYPPSNPSYPTYPPSYGAPQYPSQPALAPVPTPAPAPSVPPHMYQARQQQQQQQPTPPPQARGPPPAAAPAPGLAPEQQAMIQRLASLTPDQIALLPPADRAALMELRRQLGLS